MDNLTVEKFEGLNVELVFINNEVHFELYSTGMALGYTKTAKGKLYAQKDRIDKTVKNAEISTVVHGGKLFLNEDMLYDFMFEAKTEKCKSFKKWVKEILKTVNKTGGYVQQGREEEFIDNYFDLLDDDVKKSLTANLARNVESQRNQIKEMTPKANFFDDVLDSDTLLSTTTVAKSFNFTAVALNSLLVRLGVIYRYKNGDCYYLKVKYAGKGYAKIKTTVIHNDNGMTKTVHRLYWTEKGRKLIYDLINDNNLYKKDLK